MKLLQAAPSEVLNALSGIAYIVDNEGFLLFAGGMEWESFSANNGAFLPASAVLGQNLFEMIEGPEVQAAYKAIHERVLVGASHLAFEYRCDAPDQERLMKLALGPIAVSGNLEGVLYHSTLLSSVSRVPLQFLATNEAIRRYRASTAFPVITICAWCADVSQASGEWSKPEEYYRRGGGVDVQLSHGICPPCRDRVVEPLLNAR